MPPSPRRYSLFLAPSTGFSLLVWIFASRTNPPANQPAPPASISQSRPEAKRNRGPRRRWRRPATAWQRRRPEQAAAACLASSTCSSSTTYAAPAAPCLPSAVAAPSQRVPALLCPRALPQCILHSIFIPPATSALVSQAPFRCFFPDAPRVRRCSYHPSSPAVPRRKSCPSTLPTLSRPVSRPAHCDSLTWHPQPLPHASTCKHSSYSFWPCMYVCAYVYSYYIVICIRDDETRRKQE